MALDNFRTIELIWDKANKSIIKTIKTASSDTTGRYFSVKVLDEGQEVDLTGAKLQLYWEHPNFNTNGTDDFTTVDTKGKFTLTFSDEMLTNVGELNAYLVLTLSDGKITSDGFPIKVFKGTDNGVVVPTNGNGLVEQVARKIDKGNVTLGDLTQEVKLAMTGGAVPVVGEDAVGTENVKNGAVKPEKTSFIATGKNLFNKDTITTGGHIKYNDGTVVTNSDFAFSDYIPIDDSLAYVKRTSYTFAFYNGKKEYISGGTQTNLMPAPSGAKFLRISIYLDDPIGLDEQVEVGTVPTEYEPFKYVLDGVDIDVQFGELGATTNDITNLLNADTEILEPKTIKGFKKVGKNLFNKNTAIPGAYISHSTGLPVASSGFYYSEKIPISPNTDYVKKATYRHAWYDSNGSFISGGNGQKQLRSPEKAMYVVISTYEADNPGLPGIDGEQLEKGTISTDYEPYTDSFTFDGLAVVEPEDSAPTELFINLPKKIYGLVGQELNIYFDNIMSENYQDYALKVTCEIGGQFADYYRVVPTTSGTYTFTLEVYTKSEKLVLTKSTDIVIADVSSGDALTKKSIIIGDSTTDNDFLTYHINSNFNSDVMNLINIGTRGGIDKKHEGRAGWTTDMYMGSVANYASPFIFNSVFNFSQYLTTNGFTDIDYVTINLGINDMFNIKNDYTLLNKATRTIGQYNEIISSVKSSNSQTKVLIALTIPPNYNQDAFGVDYNTRQTRNRYKRNNMLWVNELIEAYDNRQSEGIYLLPINASIDTKNNFELTEKQINARNSKTVDFPSEKSGVHPAESGYWQIADIYWFLFKNV